MEVSADAASDADGAAISDGRSGVEAKIDLSTFDSAIMLLCSRHRDR